MRNINTVSHKRNLSTSHKDCRINISWTILIEQLLLVLKATKSVNIKDFTGLLCDLEESKKFMLF
jgi:hypothetical protein